MKHGMRRIRLALGGALAPLLLLGGCTEYTIETTLNPDGSGIRREVMEVGENDDLAMESALFRELMHTGPGAGWTHETVEEEGETTHVFSRETRVRDLASWSRESGRVAIDAVPPARARETVGHVPLGDVRFRNTVRVSTARVSDGNASYSYRETFAWENGTDVLVEALLAPFRKRLTAEYPGLTPEERGEIVGFARARLWVAVEEGLLSDEADDDALLAEAMEETVDHALLVVRGRHPRATKASLARDLAFAGDEELTTLLEETLPGMNLALNGEMRFLLRMPGRVTGSNAQGEEDGALLWEFGLLEALSAPVEIRAESVVAR